MTLLLCGCGDDERRERPVGIEVGSTAPDFQGRSARDEAFTFDPGERTTLLVFYMGGYCGPCRARLRSLQRHASEYRDAGVTTLAVTAETPEEATTTARVTGAGFPIVTVDSTTLERWGVWRRGTAPRPATYLVDDRGVIVFRHVGSHAADLVSDPELLAIVQGPGDT